MKTPMMLLSLAATISLIFACAKSTPDNVAPAYTIAEPGSGDTFNLAADKKVHLKFNVTDNDEIHEIMVYVTNPANTIIYADTQSVHAASYQYHEHFEPSGITAITAMKLKVTVSDHNENAATQNVTFYVKP
jgi:hypothetical protein